MPQEQFSLFKKFVNKNQAIELVDFFKENNIEFAIVENSIDTDVTFSGNTFNREIEIKIKPSDFEKANRLLDDEYDKTLDQFGTDHYLFSFSNEELYEILLKPDEWNVFDYKLVQKILKDRGQNVDTALLNSLKKQRIEDLSKPESSQKNWIMAGYIFSILGGALGIIVGLFLWFSKKTLPDGKKVYTYSETDRKHGLILLIIGTIFFILFTIIRIKYDI